MSAKPLWLNAFTRYFFMVIACFCYAMSLDLFLVPNSIVAGGITGAATLGNILSGIGVGVITIVLNIPILFLGLKTQGIYFIIRCFITTTLLGIFVDFFSLLPAMTSNHILAALYGGILQGIGIGLFYKYSVSSGGTELLGRILRIAFPAVSIGTMIAILDSIIVVAGAIVLKTPENVLHALIVIFVSAKVSDTIVTGLSKAKLCYIITDYPDKISKVLLASSPRGVTDIQAVGMYTKTSHHILMTCVKPYQLIQVKKLIQEQDENAFVIVGETTEVLGKGFTNIKESLL